ncbi:P-loop ATPase, Sll1717 family [Clavibacter tessellarius]|uniref:P-loop ATPase, Sll1717 family n=1 Tax=Clavibacter tessellarius TaxID=31965 RepID=UPI0039E7A5C7
MLAFKNVRFGFASAETEGAEAPDLLISGFYDPQRTLAEVKSGRKFIVLGYKGSGKSAIGQRLILEGQGDPNLLVTPLTLKDFPFGAFGKVGQGGEELESRFPTTWAWILLLRLVDSFNRDLKTPKSPQFQKAIGALERAGYLPLGELKGLVVRSSKSTFKAAIPGIVQAMHETTVTNADVGFLQLVEHLRLLVQDFQGERKHLIVIDGLDDILVQGNIQWLSLTALTQEVRRINADMRAQGVPAKIVVLCRTDMFENFPDANKNKMRRDNAITLDWYEDTQEPTSSALIALANLRIQYSTGSGEALLSDYLPGGRGAMKDLLDLTRHTPRDFLQLLENIQHFATSEDDESARVTAKQVASGARSYSINYLLPEIRDELVGIGTLDEIEAIVGLLSAMRAYRFKYSDLFDMAQRLKVGLSEERLRRFIVALFERSALGTVHVSPGGEGRHTFKYRNRSATLGYPELLVVHPGLRKGLGLT